MSLNNILRLPQSLALRLTLWYAGIFALASALVFIFLYLLISTTITQRTDQDLHEDLDEFAAFLSEGGIERVKTEMALDIKEAETETAFLRLWNRDGQQLAATELASWSDLGSLPTALLREARDGEPLTETLHLAQREHGIRRVVGAIGPDMLLEIGQSLEADEELIATILQGFLLMLVAVLLLGGPIGWFLARRALGAIGKVTRTADAIARGALDRRVPVGTQGDELDLLAVTFNTMLNRIQALIIGMREMTDNLAHDLRSPLGRIRTAAEMTLISPERKAERGSLAINVIEECDRLLEIINTTLDIAEAESGAAKLRLADIDLVALVLDACDLFQTVAEDNQIAVTTDLPKHCYLLGDQQRLQRVVANLLDNALKYTVAGGTVTISLVDDGSIVKLAIADSGVGISADEQSRIFERFYRCDRSRAQGGNGLGLSLALAMARAHGGDIFVTSALGQGSTFTLELPRPLPVTSTQIADDAQPA